MSIQQLCWENDIGESGLIYHRWQILIGQLRDEITVIDIIQIVEQQDPHPSTPITEATEQMEDDTTDGTNSSLNPLLLKNKSV